MFMIRQYTHIGQLKTILTLLPKLEGLGHGLWFIYSLSSEVKY